MKTEHTSPKLYVEKDARGYVVTLVNDVNSWCCQRVEGTFEAANAYAERMSQGDVEIVYKVQS